MDVVTEIALTTAEVGRIFDECCIQEGDEATPERVEGMNDAYSFHPSRLFVHAATIKLLLGKLSPKYSSGSGMSIMHARMDRTGHQWANDIRPVEQLFCLGIAIKAAKWSLPRAKWAIFTDEIPYAVILA